MSSNMTSNSIVKKIVGAVIFDLDGTLVNPLIDFRRMREEILTCFKSHGLNEEELQSTDIDMLICKGAEMLRSKSAFETEKIETLREVMDIITRLEMENATKITPLQGALETVIEIKKRGLLIGIITNGVRPHALKALEVTGLIGSIDALIARDEPDKPPKPGSKDLLRLISRFNIGPDEALYIGDSHYDFLTAKDTGMMFIGLVTNRMTPDQWKKYGCMNYVEHLADVLSQIPS